MGKSQIDELKKKAEKSGDIDDWLVLGDYAADRFIVGVAEQALKVVVEARPNSIKGLLLLGKALNRRRLLSEAETIYKKVLEMDPNNVEGNTGLAVVYGNGGRMNESIAYYEKAYEHDKAYPWCVHSFSNILERSHRRAEAFTIAKKAAEINPDSALIWSVLADQAKNQGDRALMEKALKECLKRIEKDTPENQRRALFNVGNIDRRKATEYAEKLLKEDPDHISMYQILSSGYMQSNPVRGLDIVNKALSIDPKNPQLKMEKAALLLATGDIPGAMRLKAEMDAEAPESFFSSVIATAASHRDPMSQLATAEGRKDYLENARKMVQRFPNDVHAYIILVQGLGLCGRREEALQKLMDIDHLVFAKATDHLTMASALQTYGLYEEADKHFAIAQEMEEDPKKRFLRKCTSASWKHDYVTLEQEAYSELEKNPKSVEAHAILARLLHADDQYESAEEHAQTAAEAGVYDSMVLLASILKRDGNQQGSLLWLMRVIDDPKVSETIRGRAYLGIGNQDKAKESFMEALAKHPGNPVALRFLLALAGRDGNRQEATEVAKLLAGVDQNALRSETDRERLQLVDEFVESAMSGKTLTELGPEMMNALLSDLSHDDEE